jgi:hypothetical protein
VDIRCGCGKTYNDAAWLKLRHDGDQEDGERVLELRRCTCGSTISRVRSITQSRQGGEEERKDR